MKRRIAILSAAVLMLSAIGFGTVSAHEAPTPETFAGNDTCEGTKIDPVASGTYALASGGSVTITVRDTASGPVFDFTLSGATVGAVNVKGGPNYNVYMFTDADHADGLHSPLNAKNGKWYGLSHICFDSTKKDDKK